MVSNFHQAPFGFGPGSQPTSEDGTELEYLAMPTQMQTFEAHLPFVENPDELAPAMALLEKISEECKAGRAGQFDLSALNEANRQLVDETFGTGEVTCQVTGPTEITVKESVFAGIWVVQGDGPDRVEIAAIPEVVRARAFDVIEPATVSLTPQLPGVFNAPALISEFMEKSSTWKQGDMAHVVNLTLLPHTPEDLSYLEAALGLGSVTIRSKGYGDCRIQAMGLPQVWKVQFFNSMDTLIVDTYEVTDIPEVALAAPEDIEDSGERLAEVLEAIL